VTQRNKDARIFVRGDKGVDYGTVMGVVSAINRAGFAKVALLTESAAATSQRRAEAPAPAAGGARTNP
jgi:biopolymer transport protein ExbD